MSSYDAWKLASPPEGITCPKCGEQTDDDGKCPEECELPCCFPERCWCGHPDV